MRTERPFASRRTEDADSGTERTGINEEPAVIEPSRGWASGAVDDRHSMRGVGGSYGEVLRTPHLYTAIGIRLLQTDTEGSSQTFRHKE